MTLTEGSKMDMLHGPLLKKIFIFSLPIAATSILQQLFNSADTAVAGRFAGSQALAAVGGNSSIITLLINLFVGLATGANVVIAIYIGENRTKEVNEVVHTAMSLALICGFMLLAIGQVVARPLLQLIGTPDDIMDLAVLYLRIYFLGMPFFLFYNFGAAILRSIGDTRKPLYALIFAGIVNVCLNLLLVIVFDMSVAGVAIATVTSHAISCLMMLRFLTHADALIRLDLKKLSLNADYVKRIIQIGLPAGLQGVVFSFSNVCIQSAINSFGSAAVAGNSAAVNFEFFTYFMTSACCQAAVTFTGQNYGARQYDRCRMVFRKSMLAGFILSGALTAVFVLGRSGFVHLFTTDPEAASYALVRVMHVEILEWIAPSFEITCAAMRGMGRSLLPSMLTVFGSCVLRIIWVFTVFPLYHSFTGLIAIYPISWIATAIMVNIAYSIIKKRMFST